MEQKNDKLDIEDIVFILLETLKSNGVFDEMRRHCVTDIDAKPTYQNWKQRIESTVHKFLSKINYTPELNKNTVRERLRKNLLDGQETQDIEEGADRILTQVLAPRTLSMFEPKIGNVVDEYLGIKNEAPPIELNGLKESSKNLINVSNIENSTVFNSKIGADNIICDKTQKDDTKDLRSGIKEKSSSLCKKPKSLNGNQSDSENDTGKCLKEKISQHKIKTSTSDKSKSSSSNHKNNTKDNICKEVVDKSKDINNKAKDIVNKPKDNGIKSKEFIDKPKKVINKLKDVIDKFIVLRSDIKEKSSSLCKGPKSLNGNQSDDENDVRESLKQKISQHKTKTSTSDKSKSSSSNHKNNTKDNICKEVVDKSKDIVNKPKNNGIKSNEFIDKPKKVINKLKDVIDKSIVLRSDIQEKSSSLCKGPKSLNDNQSDKNDIGECLKQKISQHKTKTSTSDKSKSSSSNQKSNKKDNICKEVVDKSKDINNMAKDIVNKPKNNGIKSNEFIDKPKKVINKLKDVIDKSIVLRSDIQEKSSSLCKGPKSLNDNQSDDENDIGECLKQKISQHKTKTSTSDKSKFSSSNQKSNKKDNICKEVVDKSKGINNKTKDIVNKPKDNDTKFNKFIDKPKDVIDKSKDIINITKDIVDKSKDKLFLSMNSYSNSLSHKNNRKYTKRTKRSIEEREKSSCLCKEPKLLNGNRSDDESNAGGSSKQKSTIHKNKSSSSDQTKSSSSNHKSSRKTGTIVKKSKNKYSSSYKSNHNDSKRLKFSQPKRNKLSINNERIEKRKSEKQEEPEWNDNQSSSITNDKQDAANVLENELEVKGNELEIKENELEVKENINQTKILTSIYKNDIKEHSELKAINSKKSQLSKNSLKAVSTIPSHLFEKECSVNLERYSCKNINIQSCPSNNVKITKEYQNSDEIVMDEKELKTLNVEVNLDPNENDKTNECNSNAILKVPKLKIKLLPNQIDSINKCKRKKHHKNKESKKLKLSKSLYIHSKNSVSTNIMCEKLDQTFNNNTEVKMNDSASTLSKQTSYKEIVNNSVEVLDDDKSDCSFKGFSEAETIPCKNYKILKNVIKTLQAKIHKHDVINDGFKGFTNVETHPCKHRDIVYAELIKMKDSITSTDSDFIGFSEEETQMSYGHKYVIQQLELAMRQCGSKEIQNGKIFNEVVTAYLYECYHDSDAISRAIYSKSINDDKQDCTTKNNNNHKHDNWVVEQEMKYKLLPVKVALARRGRMEYGCSSSKHVSDSSHVPI